MPNSSQKARFAAVRARGVLALGLMMSLGLANACVDPDSPLGYRERQAPTAGSAGTSGAAAGAPGDGGAAVGGAEQGGEAPVGGEGSMPMGGTAGSGGTSGAGGKAGNGGGGSGGVGGPTCGDKNKEGAEQCDDGNVANFDGCSSTCKTTCEECIDEFYSEDEDYVALVDLCNNSTDKAVEGPSAGTLRSVLCQRVVSCVVNSGCGAQGARARLTTLHDACYCGLGVTSEECESGGPSKLGNPQGPCVDAFGGAAESKSPSEIGNRLHNLTLGLGWAVELLTLGSVTGYCLEACAYETPVDDCTRCAAGDVHTLAGTALCPNGFDINMSDFALLACVEKNCKANDLAPCLSASGGPCAAELTAAGVALEATKTDLACRAQHCAAECFKP